MSQKKTKTERSALSWAGYAASTTKTPHESRGAIEEALARYGATAFAYATHEPIDGEHSAWVAFEIERIRVRMEVKLPRREECRRQRGYEQKVRTRWRLFVLLVRARLEMVTNGVQTLEEAFLPDVVTESGKTVAEVLRPQLEIARGTGRRPALTAAPPPRVLEGELEDDMQTDEEPGRVSRPRRGTPAPFLRSPRDDARRPVAELPADDEVVPVAQLTSHHQRFACTPLAAKFTVRACLARQAQADGVRRGTCFNCPLGREVAARVTNERPGKPKKGVV